MTTTRGPHNSERRKKSCERDRIKVFVVQRFIYYGAVCVCVFLFHLKIILWKHSLTCDVTEKEEDERGKK